MANGAEKVVGRAPFKGTFDAGYFFVFEIINRKKRKLKPEKW